MADDAHFAEAVRLAGGERYTCSGDLMAAAKTICLARGEGVCSSLVVHSNVLGAVVQHLGDGLTVETWPAFEQLCFYVLYHELGHVQDARMRRDFAEVPLTRENHGFEISQVARYYTQILQGEYAACVHSARWLTVAAYEYESQALRQQAASLVAESSLWKARFAADRSILGELAFSVAGQSWFLLIQFAKQVASRSHHPTLATQTTDHPNDAGLNHIYALLESFEAELITYWHYYPGWSRHPNFFLRVWHTLVTELGFHFQEDARGSAVFW